MWRLLSFSAQLGPSAALGSTNDGLYEDSLHAASHPIEPQPPRAHRSVLIHHPEGKKKRDSRFLRADAMVRAVCQWWLMGGVTTGHLGQCTQFILGARWHLSASWALLPFLYSGQASAADCAAAPLRGRPCARVPLVNGNSRVSRQQTWWQRRRESRADTHHWEDDTYRQTLTLPLQQSN